MRRAIFPGSFDPLTLGHHDIIKRGITLFDELIIAIGVNADKKYMFSLKERMRFISEAFALWSIARAGFFFGGPRCLPLCLIIVNKLLYSK